MKKVCIAALVITMCFTFSGCNLVNGNEITEITLPAFVMMGSEMSPNSELESYVSENEFESASWNDDGSLTIQLTNKRKASLQKEMEAGLIKSFENIENSPDTSFVKSIRASEGYRIILIKVDTQEYLNSFELTSYIVGMSVLIYQSYAGEDAYTDVVVIDAVSGVQIESVHYPEDE